MMASDVKVEGLNDIVRRMRQLPVRVAQRVAQTATRKAARPIMDDAIQNALTFYRTYSEGTLAENITMQTGRSRNKFIKRTRVGVQGGADCAGTGPAGGHAK